MDESDLLRCPFCGGTAELKHTSTWDYYVKCKGCGVRTRQAHENHVGPVMDWNRRDGAARKKPERPERTIYKRDRPVVRSDGRLYATVRDAAMEVDLVRCDGASSRIVECCEHRSRYKTVEGWGWMWLDEWLKRELEMED